MSSIGSPLQTSLAQVAQAAQVASKSRDKREAVTDRGRRFEDTIDLRVSGVEDAQAVRGLPDNASEQEHEEQRAHDHQPPRHDAAPDEDHPHIDLQA